uniref:Putative secreted protein n=1 Tax=Anopheles darlingi TaxID=43151 RepID=A0A2M4D152_ANODA
MHHWLLHHFGMLLKHLISFMVQCPSASPLPLYTPCSAGMFLGLVSMVPETAWRKTRVTISYHRLHRCWPTAQRVHRCWPTGRRFYKC